MSDTSVLFRPFEYKGLQLPNRIVMAPMTRNFASGGVPGQDIADYYARRAAGGVGLIITEGTVVDRPEARNEPNIPFFHGEEALDGWRGVSDAVHQAGGKIAPQIWHTGLVREQFPDRPRSGEPEGPSGFFKPGEAYGHAMSEEDVADTIAAFAKAAGEAVRLGFDAIELHGAHGYLIDQFFWDGVNQRADRWGGATIAERARFAAELVSAVRAAIGDTALILRVSQWKQQDYHVRLAPSPDDMVAWLQPLVEAGVDILHCSQRRFWEPEFPELDGEAGLNFAGWVRKLLSVPTISVGSVGLDGDFFGAFRGQQAGQADLNELIRRMEADEFDLIAVGRALITDPEWVLKVRDGRLSDAKGFESSALGTLY